MRKHLLLQILPVLLMAMITLSIAQPQSQKTILLLPFNSIGVDEVTLESARSLLGHEFEKSPDYRLILESQIAQTLHENPCSEIPCAIDAGKQVQADQAVLCKLVRLGEKIVVEYSLIDVTSENVLLTDQITAAYVEDLDVVMKRLATSLMQQTPAEKTAQVGLITEREMESARRRNSRKFTGLSFGYLYPQNGYDDADRSFSVDFRTGAEINDFAIGMQIAVRKGFAANVFGSYLITKTDFCPYLGGAFGFHWVAHTHYYDYNYGSGYESYKEKKGDGFELTANAGFLAFRTYNVQIIVNLAYAYTLNDYDDRGLVFTIGLIR